MSIKKVKQEEGFKNIKLQLRLNFILKGPMELNSYVD